QRRPLAQLAAPLRLQSARRARALPGRIRGPGPSPPDPLSRVGVRDPHCLWRCGRILVVARSVRRGRVRARRLGGRARARAPGAPANALVLDPVLPDAGQPRLSTRAPRRIYVYERDAGSLMYYRQGDLTFHARASELVIGFLASFGNYVYGINWVFRQDGSFR